MDASMINPQGGGQNTLQTGDRSWQFPQSISGQLDIVGGNGFGRYPKISSEQTFNMIVSDGALVDFAGYKLKLSIGVSNEGRTIYNAAKINSLIAVIDSGVFLIDNSFNQTRVGSLTTSTGPAWVADNLAGQIAITDGTFNVYIYDYNMNTFQTVPVTFRAGMIAYQDTYFIAPDLSSNQWFISKQSDGTVWPVGANNTGELQSKATTCVACVALDRQLLIVGGTVTEPWSDQGLQLFPYVRNSFYCIDYGTINADTIATGFGLMVWLASNQQSGNTIMYSQEASPPQTISNDGLDFVLSQLKAPKNSFGMLYKLEGHIIYHITFYTDNVSYIYDFNTQMFFSVTDEHLNYHPAKKIAFFNNSYYFVSINDGNIYEMNSQITNINYGTTTDTLLMIPRYRICKNIRTPDADRLVIQNINITMESGQNGIINEIDPPTPFPGALAQTKLEFSCSTDGGASFGHIYSKKLRLLGKRKNKLDLWNLGGIENDFVPKFGFWTYGRVVIISAQISLYP